MTTICPCCGGTGHVETDDPLDAKARELRAHCTELGLLVTPDGFVTETVAARFLGRAPKTLHNRSYIDQPIKFRRVGRQRQYHLREIAAQLIDG